MSTVLPRATPGLLALALLAGCLSPKQVVSRLESAEVLLEKAGKLNADKCAPGTFADASADARFARLELRQGHLERAHEHTEAAHTAATAAVAGAEACGDQDFDGDGIPDVIDQCPRQPEDIDGDRDEDGCRDVDPFGDLDNDGIRNIDDSCVDDPEDFDGHNDTDGCPETSEDKDGDGLIDAQDRCPDEAEDLDGFKDGDGCPDPDNDRDTLPDRADACPNAAEDIDDWEDDDGCPDEDNDLDNVPDIEDSCPNRAGAVDNNGCPAFDRDNDGVSDANDRCPEDPETRNGYLDDDGCPDEANETVTLTRTHIELAVPIVFSGGGTEVSPASAGLLDDVARLLTDRPDLRIRIEGHTDSRGEPDELMARSEERARNVKIALIERGVDAGRLETAGFGAANPIDTNRTSQGRAANNRVELAILP